MAFLRRSARPGRAGARGRGAASLLVLALCVALLGAIAPATGQGLSEVEVQAGFVYNFARFVEWPPDAHPAKDAPFVIAVLGDPELARALESGLAGKRLRGHPVRVVETRELADLDGAHVAWIGEGWAVRLPEVLRRLGDRPVLTVSAIPGFSGRGGIIELYRAGNRFRFSIDEAEAARRRLRLSSRLLSLARPRAAGEGRADR